MEIFKTVQGYDGLYEVSNYGNVKSLKFGKEKILKPRDNNRGYLCVRLYKDGKWKDNKVHRLVVSVFVPNPDNLPEVNHKDEDKTNNNVDNLEWCTHEYNINHGTHNQRMAETLTNGKKSIPVDMFSKQGELIRQFPSAHEAERWLRVNGYPKASCGAINRCCKGKLQSCYGFKWCYAQGN